MEGCLWLENLISGRFKTFPKRKDPALFFKMKGLFHSFFHFLLTLLLIGGRLRLHSFWSKIALPIAPLCARSIKGAHYFRNDISQPAQTP